MKIILILVFYFSTAIHFVDYETSSLLISSSKTKLHIVLLITTTKYFKQCDDAVEIIQEFDKETNNMFEVYILDCKDAQIVPKNLQKLKQCDNEQLHTLPRLSFIKPFYEEDESLNQEEYFYQGEFNLIAIKNFAYDMVPKKVNKIKNKLEWMSFKQDKLIESKVILFNQKSDIPYWFLMLQMIYRQRLSFCVIDPDEINVHKLYKIKHFPQLVVQKLQGFEIYNSSLIYRDLLIWLQQFQEKELRKSRKIEFEIDEIKSQTFINTTIEEIQQEFEKYGDYWFMLKLVNNQSQEHPLTKQIQKNFQSLFKYYQIQCTNQCKESLILKVKQPTKYCKLIVFGLKNKNISKKLFEVNLDDDIESIVSLMLPQVKQYVIPLYNTTQLVNSLHYSIHQDLLRPVVLFFQSNQYKEQLYFRSLAANSKFSDHLRMMQYENPTQSITQGFRLEKSVEIVYYSDFNATTLMNTRYLFENKTNYNQISIFFNQVLDKAQQNVLKVPALYRFISVEKFEIECDSEDELCIICVVDSAKQNRMKNQLENFYAIKTKLFRKKYRFIYADAPCQPKIIKQFNLDVKANTPLILYNPGKLKYQIYQGSLQIDDFLNYLQSHDRKQNWKKIYQIPFIENDCDSLIKQAQLDYKVQKQKDQDL